MYPTLIIRTVSIPLRTVLIKAKYRKWYLVNKIFSGNLVIYVLFMYPILFSILLYMFICVQPI
ncbi:unnamed protein product [Schistosoma mattheei]|uniref:Uncharacterized protein n=1 Tax=Schistosoma mattheei TaxID=31246 RepID=A0A183NM41_9TREM|nr:unnamed protein product [Schistosoma mattheei]